MRPGAVSAIPIAHVGPTMVRICLVALVSFLSFIFYTIRTTLNPQYGKLFYNIGMRCADCSPQKRWHYFTKALYYDPGLSEAYYRLGKIAAADGQEDKAFEFYKKAATLDYRHWQAYVQVGYYYFHHGEPEAAFRYLKQAYRYNQEVAEARHKYYLGILYELKKDYEAAISCYNGIPGSDPKVAEIMARKGSLCHLIGWDEGARDIERYLYHIDRDDLADPLKRFIEINQLPEYMKTIPEFEWITDIEFKNLKLNP